MKVIRGPGKTGKKEPIIPKVNIKKLILSLKITSIKYNYRYCFY